jgi:hypothetical protein
MSKAGERLLAGAREAVAVARGEKMPAPVTSYRWMVWHPIGGLSMTTYLKKPTPLDNKARAVRVRIETVSRQRDKGAST